MRRDKAFNDAYQVDLKQQMGDRWWQVRSDNNGHPNPLTPPSHA